MASDPQNPPRGLNARRDAYARGIRALCAEFTGQLEGGDELDGILSRAGTLLAAQERHLRRLEEADLEDGGGGEATVEALFGAQHLPRMILALGEVYVQEEESSQLRPLQRRALDLGRDLGRLIQDWVLAHQDDPDLLGDLGIL